MSEAITADIPLKPPVVGLKPVLLKAAAAPPPEVAVPPAEAPPAPPGVLTKMFALFGLSLTRRQATMSASAVASVLVGIVGVKLLMPPPAAPATQPLAAVEPVKTASTPPASNEKNEPPKAAAWTPPPPVAPSPLPLQIPNSFSGKLRPTQPPFDPWPNPLTAGVPSHGLTPTNPFVSTAFVPPPDNVAFGQSFPDMTRRKPPTALEERGGASFVPLNAPGGFAPSVAPGVAPAVTPPPLPVADSFVRAAGGPPSILPPSADVVPISGNLPPSVLPVPTAPPNPLVPPLDIKPTPPISFVPPIGNGGVTPPPPLTDSGPGTGLAPLPTSPVSPVSPGMALPLPGYTPATPPALTPPALPSPPAGKPLLPDLGPSASPVTPPAPLNVTPPVLEPTARPTTFLKPIDPPVTQPVAFTPEVKPLAVSQSAPKTSFDVDLHSVKASDTYASICREHYNNDAKYEVALKQFNGGRALPNSGSIEIPPIHVLRKQFPGSITTGRAAGSAEWVAPITPVVNATPQPAATEFRASRSGSYTVPAGGATLKAIARSTLGSDHRWNEIWDMNPKLVRADDTVPAGTVLNLPSDARIP